MRFMNKKSEEILKDILYEMKQDLGIDLNDTWLHTRIYQFLNDMWDAGYDDGLYDDERLEQEYHRGYKDGQNDCQETVKDAHDVGYSEGYAAGDKDGYQRALARFNNPDVG